MRFSFLFRDKVIHSRLVSSPCQTHTCADWVKFESKAQREEDGLQLFPQRSLRHWVKPNETAMVLTVGVAY